MFICFICFICLFILIHSLQVKLLTLCLIVHVYWFIHYRQSLYLYGCLLLCIDWFISSIAFTFIFLSFQIVDVFHYSYIKRKYRDSTLLSNNTDSLTYQIQTDNVYEDLYADMHLLDFSSYQKENSFYNDGNQKSNR